MKYWLLLIVPFILGSCSYAANCSEVQESTCTRILFIGNSYTFVNDLPSTFAKLAKSGGRKVEVGMAAEGGWRLSDHIHSKNTLEILNSEKWNFVVLQEQSQIPSVEQFRRQETYPAAHELVPKVKEIKATPIFFITWAHRDGWPNYGMNDYASMQQQIENGYLELSRELNVPTAPVGSAWRTALEEYPELNLWQGDGIHPSEQGTYLAACVFYAVIFDESPVGLRYRAGLPNETAQTLQAVASRTVLNVP